MSSSVSLGPAARKKGNCRGRGDLWRSAITVGQASIPLTAFVWNAGRNILRAQLQRQRPLYRLRPLLPPISLRPLKRCLQRSFLPKPMKPPPSLTAPGAFRRRPARQKQTQQAPRRQTIRLPAQTALPDCRAARASVETAAHAWQMRQPPFRRPLALRARRWSCPTRFHRSAPVQGQSQRVARRSRCSHPFALPIGLSHPHPMKSGWTRRRQHFSKLLLQVRRLRPGLSVRQRQPHRARRPGRQGNHQRRSSRPPGSRDSQRETATPVRSNRQPHFPRCLRTLLLSGGRFPRSQPQGAAARLKCRSCRQWPPCRLWPPLQRREGQPEGAFRAARPLRC